MKYGKFFADFDFFVLAGISVLFIPFFGLNSTIDPVLMPRFCAWSLLSLVLIASFTIQLYLKPKNNNYSVIKNSIFIAFLGFLLCSVISLIKAANITEGIYEILKICLSIIYLFIAAIILSKNKNYIFTLTKIIIVASILLSLAAFYEYFKNFFGTRGICDIKGTMAQRNLLSLALFMTLPFCLYAGLRFSRRWQIFGICALLSALILIFLIQTRSVWLGLFISTAATIVVILFSLKFGKLNFPKEIKNLLARRLIYIIIILVLSGAVFSYLYLRLNSIDSLVARAKSIFSPGHTANQMHLTLWQKSLKMTADNPIFGAGAGNWKILIPSYGIGDYPQENKAFKTVFFVRPENDFICVLSETGVLGFMFYSAIFVIVIFYIFKIIICDAISNDDKLFSISMFFGITGYIVNAFFQFPWERIFHSMFLLLMTASVISIYHRFLGPKKDVSIRFKFSFIAVSLFLLIFTFVIGYVRLNAEIHTKRALAARQAGNWQRVISEIDKGYSKFATLDPMSTPLQWYRGEADFILNNKQQAFEDFKKAYKDHPNHIYVLNNLGTCYELSGKHELAIQFYKQALNIFPHFEDALINLGATYYNVKRYKEAYDTLSKCDPNSQNPLLGEYIKKSKEKI